MSGRKILKWAVKNKLWAVNKYNLSSRQHVKSNENIFCQNVYFIFTAHLIILLFNLMLLAQNSNISIVMIKRCFGMAKILK